jgi:hypothetical protein
MIRSCFPPRSISGHGEDRLFGAAHYVQPVDLRVVQLHHLNEILRHRAVQGHIHRRHADAGRHHREEDQVLVPLGRFEAHPGNEVGDGVCPLRRRRDLRGRPALHRPRRSRGDPYQEQHCQQLSSHLIAPSHSSAALTPSTINLTTFHPFA